MIFARIGGQGHVAKIGRQASLSLIQMVSESKEIFCGLEPKAKKRRKPDEMEKIQMFYI